MEDAPMRPVVGQSLLFFTTPLNIEMTADHETELTKLRHLRLARELVFELQARVLRGLLQLKWRFDREVDHFSSLIKNEACLSPRKEYCQAFLAWPVMPKVPQLYKFMQLRYQWASTTRALHRPLHQVQFLPTSCRRLQKMNPLET